MAKRRALIIDDEGGVRTSLGGILEDEGYEVASAPDGDTGLRAAQSDRFDVVLCDVRMPGRGGLEILEALIAAQPEATVLVMSAFGQIEQALEAVRKGAYDYLAKPFTGQELLLAIRKADERERLRRENRQLRRALSQTRSGPSLAAASEAMRAVYELVERAAEYKTTVLVTGESGVGKEVVARAVHGLSDRASEPYVAVNCGAIPESLIESELFGHVRGAFTGADSESPGMFREADGGTLFLDEIGELPPPIQVKLLRALQEEEVRPVGAAKTFPVDVRIVAATSRDLDHMVAAGEFRADLYYRLNVFRIHVPPLRERAEDVPVLADQLLAAHARRIGKSVEPLDRGVLDALAEYAWPGNVRELENSLERALILCRGRHIGRELFPFLEAVAAAPDGGDADDGSDSNDSHDAPGVSGEDLSIKRRGRALEERLIRLALVRTRGNRTRAARLLELSPRALQYKLKEYAVDPLNPLPAGSDS
ncbi:MAG TPA: sigma-54 dependent transcriptional regulator [Myxococcota bacterium]|nr:sigma-54 dependent transcriptional regulator [Myxococcota bacterium]